MKITQDYLKSRLRYHPETGYFYWTSSSLQHLIGRRAGGIRNVRYILIYLNGYQYYAHRLAWLYVYGYMPKEIDHINRDKCDNRISNLRSCNRAGNSRNQKRRATKEGLPRGVQRKGSRYAAKITCNYVQHYLGRFDSPIEASKAYQSKRKELFGEFA